MFFQISCGQQTTSTNNYIMGKDVTGYVDVTCEQATVSLKSIPIIVLDVRTPEEFSAEHLQNAININYYDSTFQTQLGNLDKSKTYLVYCRSGHRSSEAMDAMEQMGFENVLNLEGGIIAWKEAKLPVTQ